MPDAREGACPVIACSHSSDGDKSPVLKREDMQDGDPQLVEGVEVEFCDTEELIGKVFDVINDYLYLNFQRRRLSDLRYLAHRAYNLGFSKIDIPIEVGKRVCLLRFGIHIDLYKFFFNRSIQIYAYGGNTKM